MRELEGVDRIIRFIGRPEYSDLHVFAVMVLSNCLEDTETMEVLGNMISEELFNYSKFILYS